MRAIRQSAFHGPLEVIEADEPTVGGGERLVEMKYASVNPLDLWVSQGNFAAITKLPHTGGVEGVGTIDGKPVMVRGYGIGIARPGTYAQRIAVANASIVEIPAGVDLQQAASLGVAGLTAFRCVHTLGATTDNDLVLVTGASGGVGNLAVQLAKNAGARVIGQTSNPNKVNDIFAAGADAVAVATNGDELIAELRGETPSVVVDGVAGPFLRALTEAVGIRGRIVNYGTSAGSEVSFDMRVLYRKHASILGYGGINDLDTAEAFDELFAAVANGSLKSHIDEILPLAQTGEAHRRILAKEVTGKLLIDVNA
jgi:NADPH:quinone reductase